MAWNIRTMKDIPMTGSHFHHKSNWLKTPASTLPQWKSPSLVEKGWNPLLPVNHLKKNLLAIHPTENYFHEMWKRECYTAAKCIAEAQEYNKQRYGKTHMEPDFKQGD
ncbi:hypothetical protein O181_022331 [Austropuccinia psidii MF-1]|uniref:Uncharacterized protein n=1 Tax=Austropuccinia psidii MF-1 TaxID=1389203 RepID=A0A9Q3CH86_9BASI|nr:hypothetical protein [Austropuccinia psidii MF-1]